MVELSSVWGILQTTPPEVQDTGVSNPKAASSFSAGAERPACGQGEWGLATSAVFPTPEASFEGSPAIAADFSCAASGQGRSPEGPVSSGGPDGVEGT